MIQYGLEWHALDSYFQFVELSAAPGTPEANNLRLYAKDSSGTSTLCYKNDAGTETCFSTAGGTVVTGTGTLNRLVKWTGTSTIGDFAPTAGSVLFAGVGSIGQEDNSNFFWDNTNHRLGLGTIAPVLALDISGTTVNAGAVLFRAGGASGSTMLGRQSRGTVSVPTATQNDDIIFSLSSQAHDGSAFATTALIKFEANEVQSGTAHGSRFVISTTAIGSTVLTERFRVGPSGQWGIGGATFGSSGDIFSSGGASAAPTWVTRATLNAALDHGTLAGLGDDDHTQYALLAGRSGGQTLKGGTASGDDLTLMSTNNATKGNIFFGTSTYDEVNNRLGIGTTGPAYPLQVVAGSATGVINVSGTMAANDHAQVIGFSGSIVPTVTGKIQVGVFSNPLFNPGSAVTILRAEAAEYSFGTGNGAGAITDLMGTVMGTSGYGSLKPTAVTGLYLFNIGGSGITNARCIYMTLPSGGTNNSYMDFDSADTTAAGAYKGRLPIYVGGVKQYLHYFDA